MFGRISPRKAAAILVMAAAASLGASGCDIARSSYFGKVANTWVRLPVVNHENVYVGISLLQAQGDDRVELLSVEPTGVEGGTAVTGLASVLGGPTTWAGISRESELAEGGIELANYLGVAGFQFDASDGPVALMVRVTGSEPIAGFRTVKLVFRRNGGASETAEFDVRASVCSGSTMPQAIEICQPIADEMNS